ncbi:MAG TPA: hypothetical protein VMN39_06275, partial [Longimicrobiaceae bacterium]|nr:hypothetical protein [Longimicrobiaceae bacterium]
MERRASESNEYRELVAVVGQVRRRWRLKLAMRGLAIVAAALLAAFLVSVIAIGGFHFAPAAIFSARITLAVLFVGTMVALVLAPMWKRVTNDQVALYLEEKEPSIRSALISALGAESGTDPDISPALARRTIETAVVRCREAQAGRRIESRSLSRSGGLLAGVLAAGLILFLVSPNLVQVGARALFLPLRAAEAASLVRVTVEPGTVSLPRGADLNVSAELFGFSAPGADLLVRVEGQEQFDRLPMMPRQDGPGYELRIFNLREPADYFVEAQGIRSPVHRVDLLDLPYVDGLQLELVFPEYTGIEPQTIESGGDIFAPVGTRVRLRAVPTMPVAAGRISLSSGGRVPLALQEDGSLAGEFAVSRPG